jgi:hypothetical protein
VFMLFIIVRYMFSAIRSITQNVSELALNHQFIVNASDGKFQEVLLFGESPDDEKNRDGDGLGI